MFEDKLD